LKQKLLHQEQIIVSLKEHFKQNSILGKFEIYSKELEILKENLKRRFLHIIQNKQNNIVLLQESLKNAKESKKIKKGFAQISKDNKIISLEALHTDDLIELQNETVSIKALVKDKKKIV
jgi:exodeoxyribonuclease VII large subunit